MKKYFTIIAYCFTILLISGFIVKAQTLTPPSNERAITLSVGENKEVEINGSGKFFIEAVSDKNVIEAEIVNHKIEVEGLKSGASSFFLCNDYYITDNCSSVYVTVKGTSTTAIR
ncbi:MAG: hypothetical protein M3Q63_03770 [bacterium]|nr:hypothetical protein [bacterium]